MKIKKRDGRLVQFDKTKIVKAVLAAFEEVDGSLSEYAYNKANNIANHIEEVALTKELGIEEIQDLVEKGLMSTKRKDVARAYITYRNNRTAERNRNNKLAKIINNKINALDVQNQNANMDEHSFGGRMGSVTSEVMKEYALNNCMSQMARENHLNNEIYIHDLDHYAIGDHNCLTIPFDKLLANGFNTRQTDVRPANSVSTAFQLVAVIFQLQSLQQFGGVASSHLDWTMVPYVRKSFYKHFKDGCNYIYDEEVDMPPFDDAVNISIESKNYTDYKQAYKYAMDMTEREVEQAVEGMYHNLNY